MVIIVVISFFDCISNKTYNDAEVYNISRLDEFIRNVKNKDRDKIRIVKYVYDGQHTWINKLYDLEYNGKKIKYIQYDTYSNPDTFIPYDPYYYDKVIIKEYPDGSWYGICSVDNKSDNCITLISFNKSSIIK